LINATCDCRSDKNKGASTNKQLDTHLNPKQGLTIYYNPRQYGCRKDDGLYNAQKGNGHEATKVLLVTGRSTALTTSPRWLRGARVARRALMSTTLLQSQMPSMPSIFLRARKQPCREERIPKSAARSHPKSTPLRSVKRRRQRRQEPRHERVQAFAFSASLVPRAKQDATASESVCKRAARTRAANRPSVRVCVRSA
jgi:hypothetical protein